jgi:glucosyl-3-phosphoglycerate synthase
MPAGGGRVTELMARPLLNLHWPHLAGIVQPLAGEYAGRRSLLERVPFVSGYGVEIAMLVDVFELAGLSAMAQVDLGSRRHRNSSDAALGQMSAQVYLALLSRIERHGLGMMTVDASYELTQFARDGDSFVPTTTDVGVIERPPMADVAEYRTRAMRIPG